MDGSSGIEVRNLVLETGGAAPRRLVDGASLSVAPGGALALLGESGAGKSLTALAVARLLPAGVRQASGEILFGGRAVSTMTPEELRRFRGRGAAVIPQNPMSAFEPVLSIGEHFREALVSHFPDISAAEARGRAEAAIAEAALPDAAGILRAYPFQLSGGMLQKAMIALALVTAPAFLVADEPTSDLDAASQKSILCLLRDRRRARGTGLLVITHDPAAAAWLADDVAVMRGGRILEAGAVRGVFASPRDGYTQALLAACREAYGQS